MRNYRIAELEYKVQKETATDEELAELEKLKKELIRNREYQRKYRKKHSHKADFGDELRQVNVMLSWNTRYQLRTLAEFFGITQKEMLEKLIHEKHEEHFNEIYSQN